MVEVVITPSVYGFGLSVEAVAMLVDLGCEFKMPDWFPDKYPDPQTDKARKEYAHWASHAIDRTDHRLISVVRELGDRAGENGIDDYIRLVVMEISDDVKWHISTGDEFCNEWIAEDHRTWHPEGEMWGIQDNEG